MAFEYNTTEEKLRFPAYGHMVQEMIDRATAESNPQRRQRMAEHIITVMADLNPQLQASPNAYEVLWNHLAFISNYQLDIEYPVEIERADKSAPKKLSYPGNAIRFRQYGHLIENTLDKIQEMPAGTPGREHLLADIAMRMKRCITEWKGEEVENEKVCHDIEHYTNQAITYEETLNALSNTKQSIFARQRQRFAPQRRNSRYYNPNR